MDMPPGQPDAGVVDGQHRSMSPVHAGRPDWIGSLFDDAFPTAVTPDTGLTERLRQYGSDSQNAARAFPDVVGYIVGWSVLAPV